MFKYSLTSKSSMSLENKIQSKFSCIYSENMNPAKGINSAYKQVLKTTDKTTGIDSYLLIYVLEDNTVAGIRYNTLEKNLQNTKKALASVLPEKIYFKEFNEIPPVVEKDIGNACCDWKPSGKRSDPEYSSYSEQEARESIRKVLESSFPQESKVNPVNLEEKGPTGTFPRKTLEGELPGQTYINPEKPLRIQKEQGEYAGNIAHRCKTKEIDPSDSEDF